MSRSPDAPSPGVPSTPTSDARPQAQDAPAVAADLEVDALGLICPLPVLKARKRLSDLAPGQVLAIVADDPVAVIDVPHFCAEAGHDLLSAAPSPAGGRRFVIRKGG